MVAVAINGQQYLEPTFNYSYVTDPFISDVLPISGPVSASTAITVSGINLVSEGSGSPPCIFTDAINSSDTETLASVLLHAPNGTTTESVNCTVSGGWGAGTLHVRLGSSANFLEFEKYEDPLLTEILPIAGISGATTVLIRGSGQCCTQSCRGASGLTLSQILTLVQELPLSIT